MTNQQRPSDVDVDIFEPGNVYNAIDKIGSWFEDDPTPHGRTP